MTEVQSNMDKAMGHIQKLLKTKGARRLETMNVGARLPDRVSGVFVVLLLCVSTADKCQIWTIVILILVLIGVTIAVATG